MPTYIYKCPRTHTLEISMTFSQAIAAPTLPCPTCKRLMYRVPQLFSVNWGGLPPHLEGTRSAAVKDLINNADRNRDEYLAKKESRHEPQEES